MNLLTIMIYAFEDHPITFTVRFVARFLLITMLWFGGYGWWNLLPLAFSFSSFEFNGRLI